MNSAITRSTVLNSIKSKEKSYLTMAMGLIFPIPWPFRLNLSLFKHKITLSLQIIGHSPISINICTVLSFHTLRHRDFKSVLTLKIFKNLSFHYTLTLWDTFIAFITLIFLVMLFSTDSAILTFMNRGRFTG